MSSLPVLNNRGSSPAQRRMAVDRARTAAELEVIAPGQVRFDRHHQLLYSTDASNYQIEPIGAVIPRDIAMAARVVEFCVERALPILPRGGGTSLAGQCTNRAVVIDLSAGCRAVLDLDVGARTVHVEPGIGIDELNRWLDRRKSGLFFAPDPATSAQCAIGGCIGNNAAGARSIRYGRTSENVAALDVLLTSGQRMWLGPGAGRRDPGARELARKVADLVTEYAADIRERFPRTHRRNAGYALDLVLQQLDRGVSPDDLDLTGLLCGSEGTLAVVLGATLKLHPVPRSKGLAIASFGSVEQAIDAVRAILTTSPTAVELLDDVVLSAARGNAQCRQYLELVPRPGGAEPSAVLYVEYQETGGLEQVEARFASLRAILPDSTLVTYTDASSLASLWALRKAGEPLLHGMSAHRKPVTFIEDNAIPPENLARFVRELKTIVARHGTVAAYFAHASVGVLHVRPMLDLHDPADRDRLRSIAVETADLARACGGVMSGEHGDGRVRGPLLERFFGARLMEAFARLKAIFDPPGLLNPGMIVGAGPIESLTQNLRIRPGERDLPVPAVRTYFDYADQEGFAGAVEMCNGAGVCRKTAGGVMCPSYRATLDERHSTRGRGNALRLAITGQLPGLWSDPHTMQTLDLCLSCKACKSECPSNVDVARLKAEYTAQRYRIEGAPLKAKLLGHVRTLNRLGSAMPGAANRLMQLRPMRALLGRVLGLADQRSLPRFERSLYRWFSSRTIRADSPAPRIVLFGDCFTTYNEPRIGRAAVGVLEALGYRVELPRAGCCGRAMISQGLLDDAIATIDATVAQLAPLAQDDSVAAIVVCEPSCLAAMKDEWLGLRVRSPLSIRQRIADKAMLAEDFVERFWSRHPRRPELRGDGASPVIFHGHCHQKALGGEQTSTALLRRLAGPRLSVLPSGCCGMAGAFGYAADRYELSMKIAEQSLGESLRAASADAMVVAPGTSCRHQIRDAAGREAMHPIEVVARSMGLAQDVD